MRLKIEKLKKTEDWYEGVFLTDTGVIVVVDGLWMPLTEGVTISKEMHEIKLTLEMW